MVMMKLRRPAESRRWIAAVAAMAAVALPFAGTAGAAGGAVGNPGAVKLTVTGGTLSLNDGGLVQTFGAGAPITLTGTVDGAGKLTIPKAGVNFPPTQLTDPLPIDVTMTAPADVVGSIDPDTGLTTA